MKAVIKIEEDVAHLAEIKSENTEQLKNIHKERQQIELSKKERKHQETQTETAKH